MELSSIIDSVKYRSETTPFKIAYTFFEYIDDKKCEKHVTCRELYEQSCSYGIYFKKLGVKKGDRVIIFAQQRPETIYAIYGSLLIGSIFILVPVPTSLNKKNRFYSTVQSSVAQYVVCNKVEAELIENVDLKVIDVNEIKLDESASLNITVEINEVACLQYTSGSMSTPKGIMITNKNIMASMHIMKKAYGITSDEVNVSWLPFFHSMGLLVVIFLGAYTNTRNIIMSLKVFQENPMRWINAVSKYSASLVIAPNSAYMTCANLILDGIKNELDFSSVRHMINCSEIIQKSNWDIIEEAFAKYGLNEQVLCPMYGLSEAAGPVSIGQGELCFVNADWEEIEHNRIIECEDNKRHTKVMSGVGRLVDDLKVLIIKPDTLQECKEREIGEIWIQGDSVAAGYWDNEEATKETFYAQLDNYTGSFLRTGDLGAIINGELFVSGRIKEMMVINGRNIYAKDIEINLRNNINALKELVIYAFTVPIKKKERVIIGVEYRGNTEEDYINLIKEINSVMYMYFEFEAYDIFFVEKNGLPRTDNGKLGLMRIYHAYVGKNIEVLFSSREYRRSKPKSMFTETQLEIKLLFEKILDVSCNSIEDNFLSLGGSSLDVYNLLMQLKAKFKVYIGVKDFVKYATVKQLDELIQEKRMNKK